MPRVEVEPGVELHVVDIGRGRPVVLLAGFGLCHESWDAEIRELAADHRVVAIDVRGTGRSDAPGDGYGMDRLVTDIDTVLGALDVHDAAVVGWSFGGQIALRLAAARPGRVGRLVLVCSNGVRASRSEAFPFGPDPAALEAALVRGETTARIASRRKGLKIGFHADPDPDIVDWLVRCTLRMPSWAAVASYRTYVQTDLVDDLPLVTQPVLQIMGAHDPVTPVEGAPWLQERLADGRLVVLPECGHYPMLEATDRFRAELHAFVDGA